jgi:hypothetical protein
MPRSIRTADHVNPIHNSPVAVRARPGQSLARSRATPSRKPDSGHVGTISTTNEVRRASWNAVKPRFQCVLTH